MSKTPVMPLWVSDFVGDTMDLSTREVGAYMLLLMALWRRNGSVPSDEKTLKTITRTGREWPAVWGKINRFFTVEDGAISNERLSFELQNVAAKREVLKHNGAQGGRAKSLKYNDAPLANGVANGLAKSKHSYSYPKEGDKSPSVRVGLADRAKAKIKEGRDK